MRITTAALLALVSLTLGDAALALDCARVKVLKSEGNRASDIARQLAITTPEVQSCLADEVEETPPSARQPTRALMNPTAPSSDSSIPRPPNQ